MKEFYANNEIVLVYLGSVVGDKVIGNDIFFYSGLYNRRMGCWCPDISGNSGEVGVFRAFIV